MINKTRLSAVAFSLACLSCSCAAAAEAPNWAYENILFLQQSGYSHYDGDIYALSREELRHLDTEALAELKGEIDQQGSAGKASRFNPLTLEALEEGQELRERLDRAEANMESAGKRMARSAEKMVRLSYQGQNRTEIMEPLKEKVVSGGRAYEAAAANYARARMDYVMRGKMPEQLKARQGELFKAVSAEGDTDWACGYLAVLKESGYTGYEGDIYALSREEEARLTAGALAGIEYEINAQRAAKRYAYLSRIALEDEVQCKLLRERLATAYKLKEKAAGDGKAYEIAAANYARIYTDYALRSKALEKLRARQEELLEVISVYGNEDTSWVYEHIAYLRERGYMDYEGDIRSLSRKELGRLVSKTLARLENEMNGQEAVHEYAHLNRSAPEKGAPEGEAPEREVQ